MNLDTTKVDVRLAEIGITKADLANRCGLSRQSISTIIRRGSCEPKTAGKLAAGLGIPVSEIVRRNT